ncbi:MAG: cob(I)yrinic acid a,c-diamide adenosyltransferase [Coxiellaceae bacterium]|jgi:cob(I)alamin adenosyltransferase|nr:cob(I)yrinic acid a,c-diamide adenosyltransferase [Coxiellaceae bacterium]
MNKRLIKSGDDGCTTLPDGKRVKKSSEIIELYGVIDELNVFLGFAAESMCCNQDFDELLKAIYRIQNELFELCANLGQKQQFVLSPDKLKSLESELDTMSRKLPVLSAFILPGGGEQASRIHLARAVCRRAERVAFKFAEINNQVDIIGIYLNRLSSWLYFAARASAFIANSEEILVKN